MDFLQEKDVFREFLYRINTLGTDLHNLTWPSCLHPDVLTYIYCAVVCLGWSSRTQFEETWATLLGVLVTQPITMDQEEETQQEVKDYLKLISNERGCETCM